MDCKLLQLLLLLLQLSLLLPIVNSACKARCSEVDSCRHPRILILDAGSTGTRVHVYQFESKSSNIREMKVLSEASKATRPGLDSFANFPQRIHHYLQSLINFSKAEVPVESHCATPILLAATAGVRALTSDQKRAVTRAAAASLRRTPFSILIGVSDHELAMVLRGTAEASFAWVAANALLGGFKTNRSSEMYGTLDLGGGSTQVTAMLSGRSFQDSSPASFGNPMYWVPFAKFPLYVSSYLGLGKSAAALEMFGYNGTRLPLYRSPCLHQDFSEMFSFGSVSINVSGDSTTNASSRWKTCQSLARAVLQKIPVRKVPSAEKPFEAISAFYYVAKSLHMMGYMSERIPGVVTLVSLSDAASRACLRPPSSGKYAGYLCLDSAYIVTLLKEGYEFPDEQRFNFINSVSGISIGWSLGLAATALNEPDFIRAPKTIPQVG